MFDKVQFVSRLRRLVPPKLKSAILVTRGALLGKWPLELAVYTLKKSSNKDTLTGKIRFKMAYDTNPQLTIFADKLQVRDFVKNKIGSQYLPNLHAVIYTPKELASTTLPPEFALKSNNGSGGMVLAWSGAPINQKLPSRVGNINWEKYLIHPASFDLALAQKLAYRWLNQNFYYRSGYFPEFAYRDIPPALLLEELMLTSKNELPSDYKFFMINGKCEFIQLDESRYGNHTRDLYTPSWERIQATYKYPASEKQVMPPECLTEMISVAEVLSAGTDFLRVDLYATSKGVRFGELTNYPGGGIEKFTPNHLDVAFGERWVPNYPNPMK